MRRAGEGGAVCDQGAWWARGGSQGAGHAVELVQGGGGGGGGGGGEQPLQGAVAEQRVGGEEEGGRGGQVGHLQF